VDVSSGEKEKGVSRALEEAEGSGGSGSKDILRDMSGAWNESRPKTLLVFHLKQNTRGLTMFVERQVRM
jgi:hypothetical protein